ncbi:solute carrier organic anion transporter family member 74D-like [Stegodyphus dumicola]|uniref:solute carrier organic anion transporter family member 74D-like n=1 Tax=Stegodyphus dumicola TaxID=202533 RepID=UPI0015A7D342|nr:solute carrier organic anion transporter family member 74D-like [Stegodyphus dumicola]
MPTKVANPRHNSLKTDFQSMEPEQSENLPDDEEIMCGVGSFYPAWLQKFSKPKVFFVNHTLLGLLQGAFFTYLVGCLSTLEKRYGYETKITGIIMISEEISPILFGLLLGYFGGKAHRPRIVAIGMVVAVVSCFIMAAPYFIYGSILYHNSEGLRYLTNKTKHEICDHKEKDYFCEKSPTLTAVSLLFFGNFLKGIGTLAFYIIGTSYLDDSIKKKNSPVYFGTLFSLRLLGPTCGFLLCSLCLNFYEDPFYDPGFGTKDPRWIGAWWLGFIILGIAILILSLPMTLFPRRFPGKQIPSNLQTKSEEAPMSRTEQLKDMGKAMKRIAKNPILICHYLGGIFRMNGLVGYYVLLPKYMEMQFRESASKASLYSGPAGLVGMQAGILLGGIAIRKFKPRPRVMTGGIVIAESFSAFALIACMCITCPLYQMTGTSSVGTLQFDLQNECNADCLCTTKMYTPICGPDGKSTYFSPCYAGCSAYNKTGEKEIFTDCKCVHNDDGEITVGDATKNYCNFECQWLITFVVVLSAGKLLASTASVANALVTLRCVDPEDKSLALGALSAVFSLLAFIPYPLIYGSLTDASCLVWEECGKRGSCWIYDSDKFRFLLHGVSAAFVFLGCLTDIMVCVLSSRLKNLYDDEDDGNTEKQSVDETDVINEGRMLGLVRMSSLTEA